MENFNHFRGRENHYKEVKEDRKKEKKDDFDPKRREFIKKGAVALAGIALGSSFWRKEERVEKEVVSSEEEVIQEKRTEEQEKIEEENITSLCEVLDFEKKGEIKLDSETMEAIKNHWKKKYQEVPELRDSLKQAYFNMGEWHPYLEDQFQEEGVSEKYLYLAIPESHWQVSAVSSAGAVGPYQFIPATARSYGLKTKYFKDHPQNIEERKDPIKSARACACLLKDLYRKSGDWNMSLSGYNGGFFWRHLRQAKESKEPVSYDGFLGYLESKINKIKKEVEDDTHNFYKVKKGENMTVISKKLGLGTDELCSFNNIEDENNIYEGQVIKTPTSVSGKKELFKKRIKGFAENLNYPPKFNAIYELIEEGFVKDRKEPFQFQERKAKGGFQKRYVFKEEDINIYRLSLKLGVSSEQILRANPQIDPSKMKGGEELLIPGRKDGFTLEGVAQEFKTEVLKLKEINPAIESPSKEIPEGYNIRIYSV